MVAEGSNSSTDSDPLLLSRSGSNSKGLLEKRSSAESRERSENAPKKLKTRDLESVHRSEGITAHCSSNQNKNRTVEYGENETSEITEEPKSTYSSAVQADRIARRALRQVDRASGPSGLSSEGCTRNTSTCAKPPESTADTVKKPSSLGKHKLDSDVSAAGSRGSGLDLNTEVSSSMASHNPFYPYKNLDNLRSGAPSECGSTTGPLESGEKDPLRIWKEMKKNGFLSSTHGGIPVPKPQTSSRKNTNVLKKKMELAKKEQVDRFTKVAAPSGLLNELNPGIINHVRNSRQVHSIIEALVRSEKLETARQAGKQEIQLQRQTRDGSERCKYTEIANNSNTNFIHLGATNSLSRSKKMQAYPVPVKKSHIHSSLEKGGDSSTVERRDYDKSTCTSHGNHEMEDDMLALKLSSTATMPETMSSAANDEAPNISGIPSLSVKAASVASQWLDILHQDIRGRLAALRRSKKRVKSAIITELPFLRSKEFPSRKENDLSCMEHSAHAEKLHSSSAEKLSADLHYARWSALFGQMDKALCEEEKQLETCLNQVKEMQLHCGWGLQRVPCGSAPRTLQELGINDTRSDYEENSERDLAIRAAAASIYSTCNFLLSAENVPCF